MKTKSNIMMTALAAALLAAPAMGAADEGNGVRVEHLGTNNSLVRVTADGRYLLLPVEESNDDATVNLVVDGKPEKTIYVRLAKSKVDYTVPLDIEKYRGRNLILNIVTSQGRNSIREAKDDACWGAFSVTDTFDTANREKYRPAFHHTPLYGWMNDPNGMFYKDGRWHLYYQWNPYGSKWQNMTWGHSSTADLVNWEHHPAAIEPNGLGTVFSGSAAIDRTGSAGFGKDAVVAMYTSAGASQIQSLAASHDDGLTFDIYPGNPVLTLESEARDPNMFWNKATGEWNLVLAHALDREMLFFTSPDMKTWTLRSAFGKGEGAQEGVWECPDLFELPIEGEDATKWVLLCNINPGGPFGGSATQYFIGDFDGTTFTADTDALGKIPTKWLDYGKDHYATVSFSDAPDGRRTVMGWMSNWQYANEVPTRQYRSANTLPRDLGLFRDADGQLYVASAPSPETDALRSSSVKNAKRVKVGSKATSYAIPELCEIVVDATAPKGSALTLTLANDSGEKTVLTYDPATDTVTFDRTESGITDFSRDFPCATTAPAHSRTAGEISLRIFIDKSSIEVFGDEGRFVMTNLVFPTAPYSRLSIASSGANATIHNLKIYKLL